MSYTDALEQRLKWLNWAKGEGAFMYKDIIRDYAPDDVVASSAHTLRIYQHQLECGPTFYMNSAFCDLVDTARRTIPDDLQFDASWMVTKSGWMWLEKPFAVPKLAVPAQDHDWVVDADGQKFRSDIDFRISAIGWQQLPERALVEMQKRGQVLRGTNGRVLTGEAAASTVYFTVYLDRTLMDRRLSGFGMWSFFAVVGGDTVIERIRQFEEYTNQGVEGGYKGGREADMLHEIRWIYAAMHLMSQKLAVTRREQAARSTRRRWEREQVPLEPLCRVVTLRRLEEAQAKEGTTRYVEWTCQWMVHGFWRQQYFPSTGEHKPVWIDDYIKGPPDRPFKAAGATIYKAVR